MSGPMIMAGIKLVGSVMAAKTAVEGIKEGNLLKAVAGGVGAYMGFSGLAGAGATGVSSTTGTALDAATEAGSATASASAGGGVTTLSSMTDPVAQNLTSQVATGGADAAMDFASAGKGTFMDNLVPSSIADPVAQNVTLNAGVSAIPGLLETLGEYGGKAMDYMEKNPMVALSAAQMGGGLLQGMSQEKMMEAKWKREEEDRRRRAATADTSFMNKLTYDSSTGRFV